MTSPKLGVALCAVLSGCGGPLLLKQHLAERYSEEFACSKSEVLERPSFLYSAWEYRVEGCGEVAFYSCDVQHCHLERSRPMTDAERAAADKRHAPAIAAAAAEKHRIEYESPAGSELAAARAALEAAPDKVQPLGQVASDDWRMTASSLPDHASFLLIAFSTQRELAAGTCRPTFSVNNRLLITSVVGEPTTHEARFLVEAGPLRTMEATQPVRGLICGADFSMDEPARTQLAGVVSTP